MQPGRQSLRSLRASRDARAELERYQAQLAANEQGPGSGPAAPGAAGRDDTAEPGPRLRSPPPWPARTRGSRPGSRGASPGSGLADGAGGTHRLSIPRRGPGMEPRRRPRRPDPGSARHLPACRIPAEIPPLPELFGVCHKTHAGPSEPRGRRWAERDRIPRLRVPPFPGPGPPRTPTPPPPSPGRASDIINKGRKKPKTNNKHQTTTK